MPQAHRFLFAAPRFHSDRALNIALTRDSEANSHLEHALMSHGFSSGVSILNFPRDQRRFDLLPFDYLFQVELPFLTEGDVLCQSTRPPLSDGHHNDNKKVEPSNSTLERATFFHWWRYFRRVSRSSVVFRDEVAKFLPAGYRNRHSMTFNQNEGCGYQFLQEPGRSKSKRNPLGSVTVGFLLRVEEIVPGGPGFVAAWGMNAEATLAWCRMLRYQSSDLLAHRGLTMVELYPTQAPASPTTYSYMDDWKFDIVFETPGEMPPLPSENGFAIAF